MSMTAKWQAAAEALDVELDTLTADQVERAYRSAAKACHPDTGNYDAVKWAAIGNAKTVLLALLERRATAAAPVTGHAGNCRACAGSGRIQTRAKGGFGMGVKMMCVLCSGTGNVQQKDRDQ